MYFFLFIILPLLLLLSFVYGGLRGAPWVPMRARDVERVMKLAEINAGQKIYDLGCGDGRVLLAAAERGAEAIHESVSFFFFHLSLRYAFQVIFNRVFNGHYF